MSRLLELYLGRRRARRRATDTHDWIEIERRLIEELHPRQRDFVLDPSRRIAACVARRAGKTTGGLARFLRRMMRTPRARCCYIAVSRPHAEELIWEPLKDLTKHLGLDAHFGESKLVCTLKRNGSQLRLFGADDQKEIEKQRGKKFHEVGIDEAASHSRTLLDAMIHRILGPGLTDYRGPLWLVGTPAPRLTGIFHEITGPGSTLGRLWSDRAKPEFANWLRWSTHHWSLEDNDRVHLPDCPRGCTRNHLWEEALLEKAANGWSDDHPIWRREYRGEWIADDTGYVFKFRAKHPETGERWNTWVPGPTSSANPFGLPSGHVWQYVYGFDLGHADPFAMEVLAFADTSHDLYQVYEYVAKPERRPTANGKTVHVRGLSIAQMAEIIRGVVRKTGWPAGMVADTAGLGGDILAELAQVYGIPIEAAEKKQKADAIELVNGDLIDGHFKALEGSQVAEEMATLQYDDTGLQVNASQPNHCCDAVIYARRRALHKYARDPAPPGPAPGTAEAIEAELAELERREDERDQRQRRGDFFPDDLGDDDYDDLLRGGDPLP